MTVRLIVSCHFSFLKSLGKALIGHKKGDLVWLLKSQSRQEHHLHNIHAKNCSRKNKAIFHAIQAVFQASKRKGE